jgi:hypothetical protein
MRRIGKRASRQRLLTAGDLAVAGQALGLEVVGGLDQGTAGAGLARAAGAGHRADIAHRVDAAGGDGSGKQSVLISEYC